MNDIIENWYIILAGIVLLSVFLCRLVRFFKKPSADQVAQVKEWLLYAVIAAEKQFGTGTGTVKLRSVYDLFVARFPWVAKVIPFTVFSGWVDEALDNMRQRLEENQAIADYVYGADKLSNDTST